MSGILLIRTSGIGLGSTHPDMQAKGCFRSYADREAMFCFRGGDYHGKQERRSGGKRRAESAANGSFTISGLPDGAYELCASPKANSQTRGNSPDQERDSLTKAHQDYKRAQELYDQIRLFGDVERNRSLAIDGQERVAERLRTLQFQVPGSPP